MKRQKEEEPKPLSDVEWDTCWMAMRYAMNRQTIASASLPDQLIKAYFHRWSKPQKASIVRELKQNLDDFEHAFGNPQIDKPVWIKFMNALDESTHYKVILIDDTTCTAFEVGEKVHSLEKYIEQPYHNWYIPKENIKQIIGKDKTITEDENKY